MRPPLLSLAGVTALSAGIALVALAGGGAASAAPALDVAAQVDAGDLGIPLTVSCFTDADQPMVSSSAFVDFNLGRPNGTPYSPSEVTSIQIVDMKPVAPGGPATGSTTMWVFSRYHPDPGETLIVDVQCNGIAAGSEFPSTSFAHTVIQFTGAQQPQPHAPRAVDHTYTLSKTSFYSAGTPGLLAGATDEDGDAISVSQRRNVSFGSVLIWPDGAFRIALGSELSEIPDQVTFEYNVVDATGLESEWATVTLNLTDPTEPTDPQDPAEPQDPGEPQGPDDPQDPTGTGTDGSADPTGSELNGGTGAHTGVSVSADGTSATTLAATGSGDTVWLAAAGLLAIIGGAGLLLARTRVARR